MKREYGTQDASYLAAGGEAGIRKLVDDFYTRMEEDRRFQSIFDMHPPDIAVSRDKLASFLCGWLGGPRLFKPTYRFMGIPAAHRHLPITITERDLWLQCMSETVAEQPFAEDFKHYLLEQLAVPANAIVRACNHQPSG